MSDEDASGSAQDEALPEADTPEPGPPSARPRPQRLAVAAALVALAAVLMWMPREGTVWVQVVLSSVLVLVALGLVAWSWLPLDQAASLAAAVYVAIGFLLAVAEVAYIGTAWRGGVAMLAIFVWPSLVLVEIGRWLGVQLPE